MSASRGGNGNSCPCFSGIVVLLCNRNGTDIALVLMALFIKTLFIVQCNNTERAVLVVMVLVIWCAVQSILKEQTKV